jgi:hypothetical protein
MVEILRRLIAAAIALGLVAGNADEIEKFYNETVATAARLATAADLRSIGTMLDAEYLRRGRYPGTDRFEEWMTHNFKENPVKALTADHWGTALAYRALDGRKGFVLVSAGPDRIFDTIDDLKLSGP